MRGFRPLSALWTSTKGGIATCGIANGKTASGFPAGQIGGIMGAMRERQASRGLLNCAGAVATKTALPLMFA